MSAASNSPSPERPKGAGREVRVAFMGTPGFAVPSLRALLALPAAGGRPLRVVAVVTQPDRPAGRGGRVQAGPVKAAALEAGIPVLQPERLRRPESVAALRGYAPDLVVVAAFAQILPPAVLDLPTYGCLNVHASLLPRWRGASPIAAAILAGDETTGVTIMKMDAGLDTGPIVAQRPEPIRPDDTAGALTERLAALGADLLAATLGLWIAGDLAPREQDEAQATLTRPLRRVDGLIDWSTPAGALARMVRAYDPWPGAHTTHAGRILKVWQAVAIDGSLDAPPARVATQGEAAPLLAALGLRWPQVLVSCGSGVLLLRRVQPEGKRPMGGDEFMRGQRDLAGAQLGA